MSAGSYNFSIEQGSSFGLSFVYKNSSGVPIDLDAFSCGRMQWNFGNVANASRNNLKITSTEIFSTTNTASGLYHFKLCSATGFDNRPRVTSSGSYITGVYPTGGVGQTGVIEFKLPASVTAALPSESAYYDLELQSSSDFYAGGGAQITRLLQGTVSVLPEITKVSGCL